MVDEYLVPKESTQVAVDADNRDSALSNYDIGQLVVTDHRLAFVGNGGSVVDVSLAHVAAVEMDPPSLPTDWLAGGVVALVTGLVLLALQGPIQSNTGLGVVALVGGVMFIVGGVALFVWAILNRRGRLVVHTPAESYRFTSSEDELENVVHAVRGQE